MKRIVVTLHTGVWKLELLWMNLWPKVFAPAEFLSESSATAVLDSDDIKVSEDLPQLQKNDPTKTYHAFVPTAPLNVYSLTMSKLILNKLIPGDPSDRLWGARIPGNNDFMTWVLDPEPGLKLIVTRLRATASSFPVLLHAALRAAQDAQCECIEMWNVPEHLKEVAQVTGGITA